MLAVRLGARIVMTVRHKVTEAAVEILTIPRSPI